MPYIIIALNMLTAAFYPIESFGFKTHIDCQTFIEEMIVAPESDTIYGCFKDERLVKN